jgi:6-phosphogluconolactonase
VTLSGLDRIKSRTGVIADVVVHSDLEALARAAAEIVCSSLSTGGQQERLAVVLSGGSTPKRLYQLLASEPYRERVPWKRVHWFFGDERFVLPDSPRSNFGLVWNVLLSSVVLPETNIHPIHTKGLRPEAAANAYAKEIEEFRIALGRDRGRPLFDVVLLGLGEDGHIASLFPGSAALDERAAWVTSAKSPESEWRITLTYPALESCKTCLFLVAGATKTSILSSVARGEDFPATRLNPQGRCLWLVDRAAADS